MLDLIGNDRPAGDVLSRVVRVTLGGVEYTLPVLTIGGNKRWHAQLDARLGSLLTGLEDAGDDITGILAVLGTQTDDLLTLLLSYECPALAGVEGSVACAHLEHVLPVRAHLEEVAYESELLAAVREVWRAANPLVGISLADLAALGSTPTTAPEPPGLPLSPRTNSPRSNGAGRPRTSKRH